MARRLVRTSFVVLAADLVFLAAAFWVVQDVQMRLSCSLEECTPILRTSPSFAYSFLTKSFSMTINGRYLVSPLTLDWLQVLAAVFIAVNVWYGYSILAKKGNPPKNTAMAGSS